MSDSKRVLIRCDAGPGIGAGHMMRCMTLAGALARRGFSPTVLALPGSREAVAGMVHSHVELVEAAAADDAATLRGLAPAGCTLAIVDSYRLDAHYLEALEGWAERRFVLQDRPAQRLTAEIVLDPTFGRRPGDYAASTASSTLLLTGPDYALVRPAFAKTRGQVLARRTISPVKRLLVALGGGDAGRTLDVVLDGIGQSGLAIEVHVAGRLPDCLPARLGVARLVAHGAVADMQDLIGHCDLAIGAAGGSAWERATLGLPTLMIELAENQADNISGLVEAGAAQSLGRARDLDAARVASALNDLAADSGRRARMAMKAALMCDGLGAGRVALAVHPRVTRDGLAVTLRRATAADSRTMFAWQQRREVRRFTPHPLPPTWEEHSAWLEQRLAHPQAGTFDIIEHGDDAAGVLRLDPLPAERWNMRLEPGALVVSILVDPDRHGLGIAAAALAAARDLVPVVPFYAEVLPGNAASHSLFRNTGYAQLKDQLYRFG